MTRGKSHSIHSRSIWICSSGRSTSVPIRSSDSICNRGRLHALPTNKWNSYRSDVICGTQEKTKHVSKASCGLLQRPLELFCWCCNDRHPRVYSGFVEPPLGRLSPLTWALYLAIVHSRLSCQVQRFQLDENSPHVLHVPTTPKLQSLDAKSLFSF